MKYRQQQKQNENRLCHTNTIIVNVFIEHLFLFVAILLFAVKIVVECLFGHMPLSYRADTGQGPVRLIR